MAGNTGAGGGNGGYGGGGGGSGPPVANSGPGSGKGGGGNGGLAHGWNGESGEGRGGAILLCYGSLAITGSTAFINNSAWGGFLNGTRAASYGGAIYVDPEFQKSNKFSIDSSVTFSSNFAMSTFIIHCGGLLLVACLPAYHLCSDATDIFFIPAPSPSPSSSPSPSTTPSPSSAPKVQLITANVTSWFSNESIPVVQISAPSSTFSFSTFSFSFPEAFLHTDSGGGGKTTQSVVAVQVTFGQIKAGNTSLSIFNESKTLLLFVVELQIVNLLLFTKQIIASRKHTSAPLPPKPTPARLSDHQYHLRHQSRVSWCSHSRSVIQIAKWLSLESTSPFPRAQSSGASTSHQRKVFLKA